MGETFIKHLPSEKNYLYNLILKSLIAYHSQTSIDLQLKELLSQTEMLYHKGLHFQATKILEKAEKLAYSYEASSYIIEIFSWKNRIGYKLLSEMKGDLEEKEINETVFVMKNNFEYKMMLEKMSELFLKIGSVAIKIEDKNILHRIINLPLMKDEKMAITFEAKVNYHYIYAIFHQRFANHQLYYESLKKAADLFEHHPEKINIFQKDFLKIMSSMQIVLVRLDRNDEAIILGHKLRKLQITSYDSMKVIYMLTSLTELNIYCKRGDTEKGIILYNEVKKQLLQFRGMIRKVDELSLYYLGSFIYFSAMDYKNSLTCLNKILSENNVQVREDLLRFAKIFNIVLHFELGNLETLQYAIKTAQRYLLKTKHGYKFETALMNFIDKRLSQQLSERELSDAFKDLKKKLVEFSASSSELAAMKSPFNYIIWVEGKIEKKSYAEMQQMKQSKTV